MKLTVATTIVDLTKILISQYAVSQVFICSILNRTSALHALTPDLFKQKAYQLNNFLRTMCDGERQLTYHVHQGFWLFQSPNGRVMASTLIQSLGELST